MKSTQFFLLASLISVTFCEEFKLTGLFFGCSRDVTHEYHKALQDFSTRLYKEVAKTNNDHFVLSQYSIWLALSSIAEGSEGETKSKLFKALNLPEDTCLREKYYEIATSLESPGLDDDVTLKRKRVLVVDESVKLNTDWSTYVRELGLIDTKVMENNTDTKASVKDTIDAKLDNINVTGNVWVLDSLDYKGFWTTAFDRSKTVHYSDFFNDSGKKIGNVTLMKIKKRVKLAHIPFLNAKLLELPVGSNGRYRMIFIMNLGRNSIRRTIVDFPSTLIVDIMPLLIESVIPLEVAIPKFDLTSELDLKKALERIHLDSIWSGANSSRYISNPPTPPSSVIQQVSIQMEEAGLSPPPVTSFPSITNVATGVAGTVGRGFVANRPFIFGLLDAQTRTWLFSGAFSKPGL